MAQTLFALTIRLALRIAMVWAGGFALAVAVFLDALVVRCMLLPAVLEILGPVTWRLPRWLDARLPHVNVEGSSETTEREPLTTAPIATLEPTEPVPTVAER